MRIITLLSCLLMVTACSTPRGTENRRQIVLDAVVAGDFITAEKTVDKIYGGKGLDEPGDKHQLLWYMQRGALQCMQHDFINAELFLERASALVDERRGVSVGGAVGAAVANETARAYDGEAFEHTQIELLRVLNHVVQANILEGIYTPPYTFSKDIDGSMSGPAVVDGRISSVKHFERARNIARKMTLDLAKETEDAAGSRRYDKDSFANLLSGALVLSLPQPSNNDRQLADALFYRAMEAYPDDLDKYAQDGNFHFEVRAVPSFAEALQARNGLRYNPEKFKSMEKHDWKSGQGSIFIVHQHGLTARPQTLDIRFVSAVGSKPANSQSFHVGGVGFYASGPDTDALRTWGDLALPGDVVDDLFGSGLAIMGFAMPVHERDQPIAGVGQIHAMDVKGEFNVDQQLEVASDIDAYARATLKDEQPALFVKTFARSAAKQIAAHVTAEEAAQENPLGGFLTRLVGSSVATMTEVADTRSWWLLPNHISASLVDLPAGDYHLQLSHSNGSVELGTVTVQPNRVVIIPARTFGE